LPEGAAVTVSCDVTPAVQPAAKEQVEFPLVHSQHPGTLRLTARKVADLLEEQDLSS